MSMHTIKVTLEYTNNIVNEEIIPYKTIKFLKERVMKIFYPLNYEIKLFYMNKDLTNFENIALGEYFKNKSNITIKVVQVTKKKSVSNHYKTGVYYNSQEINDNKINLNEHDLSNRNVFNDKKNKTTKDEEFTQKIETKYPKKNKLQNAIIEENQLNFCQCGISIVNFFCRSCNVFLCKNCRIDYKHLTHKSLNVDVEHAEESVKLYAITLQSDIDLNIKAGRIYSNNFQNKKFIDIDSRKEIIIRKLDEIERRLQSRITNLPNIDEKEINVILSNLEDQGYKASGELEDIIDLIYKNYFKQNKKLSFEEMNKMFQQINNKEKEIDHLSNSILAYKINFEIHKKIDEMYNIIEKAIDKVIFHDLKKYVGNNEEEDNFLNLETIKTIKESKNSSKVGDLNAERKMKKKEETKIGINSLVVPDRVPNKSREKTIKNSEERNIVIKRTVIEAVDKDHTISHNTSHFKDVNNYDSLDYVPLGVNYEADNKINHRIIEKKKTEKRNDVEISKIEKKLTIKFEKS